MTESLANKSIALSGNLVLTELSAKNFPDIDTFVGVKTVELEQLKNIDSAGIAYLAQLKSCYPAVSFTGGSNKIHVLANLYGLNFIFR